MIKSQSTALKLSNELSTIQSLLADPQYVSDPKETPEAIRAVYKLIVAVDIGTAYTKVAWSWSVTQPAGLEAHLFVDGQWKSQQQVPTAVLYRPAKHSSPPWEFDSFGHEAMYEYKKKQGCALFQTFKMELHNTEVGTFSACTC